MPNSSNRFENNFDALRILAALAVIFSHSYALLGVKSEPVNIVTGSLTAGTFAVGVFFAISGYLITLSWERKPQAFIFLKKRVLRIFPALIIVVFFSVFFLGPVVTTLSLNNYFSNPQTWRYLLTISLYYLISGGASVWTLPGVFTNNPFPNAVNGSLWMMPYLFSMYLIIPVLGKAALIKKGRSIILLYLLAILLLPINAIHPLPFLGVISAYLIICFSEGAILYLYRDKIRLDWKIVLLSLFIWALSFAFSHNEAYLLFVSSLVLPYLVVYFAFIPTPHVHKLTKYGDFSYGLFIYSFPIQQLFVFFFVTFLTPAILFGLSVIVTLPTAILSWVLIESRALKFK